MTRLISSLRFSARTKASRPSGWYESMIYAWLTMCRAFHRMDGLAADCLAVAMTSPTASRTAPVHLSEATGSNFSLFRSDTHWNAAQRALSSSSSSAPTLTVSVGTRGDSSVVSGAVFMTIQPPCARIMTLWSCPFPAWAAHLLFCGPVGPHGLERCA